MKKNWKLFGFAALAALMFAGCAKDATDDVAAPEQEMFTLTITPEKTIEALSAGGDTRTYWDEETGNIEWVGNEYMYFLVRNEYRLIQNDNGNYKFTYNKDNLMELFQADEPVLLTGIIPEEYYKFRNVKDRSQAPKKVVLALPSDQESTAASFDSWLDVMVGSKEITLTADEIANNFHQEVGMPFARIMAISKYTFPITNEKLSADEPVESVTLTVVPGEGHDPVLLTGSYNLDISAIPARCIDNNGNQINLRTPFQSGYANVSTTYPVDAQPTLGELVFWPITAPVKLEAGDQLRFRIVTNKHEITKTITLSKALYYENNKLNWAKIKLDADTNIYSFDEVVDLSAGGTANSYIVNKPRSTYKFRADVKGNDAAQTIDPRGAVVLWYNRVQKDRGSWLRDCPIVIESVKLTEEGYIEFSTPEVFVNGNVLIAAIDQPLAADQIEVDPATRQFTNTNILWSWNLIVSEGYDPDDATQKCIKGGYTFMKRDLGAVLDPDTSLGGYTKASTQGNCYQWGRKDPFPHIADYSSANATYMTGLWFTPTFTTVAPLEIPGEIGSYGKVGNQIFGNTDSANCGYIEDAYGAGYTVDQALEYAAQNPHLWIRSSKSSWIPANEQSLGNWGKGETKTVNDPCPAGWMVMSEAAWMVLSDNMEAVATAKDRYVTLDGQLFPLFEGRNLTGSPFGYTGSCNGNVHAKYYTGSVQESTGDIRGRAFDMVAPFNYDNPDNDPSCRLEMQNVDTGNGARIRCIKE